MPVCATRAGVEGNLPTSLGGEVSRRQAPWQPQQQLDAWLRFCRKAGAGSGFGAGSSRKVSMISETSVLEEVPVAFLESTGCKTWSDG